MSLVSTQSDPQAVLDALASEAVCCAVLVELQFASVTKYMCNLAYPFTDPTLGHTWEPMGDLVDIQDVTYAEADLAPYRSYTLGVPTEFMSDEDKALFQRMPLLMDDPSEFIGGAEIIRLQFFDLDNNPIGEPIVVTSGTMDNVDMSIDADRSTLTLTVEGVLARKNVPLAGFLTDRDQRARFPADTGLGFVTEVNQTEVTWTDW